MRSALYRGSSLIGASLLSTRVNTKQFKRDEAASFKSNAQYVVTLVIDNLSVERFESSAFNPFSKSEAIRSVDFTVSLVDGATGQSHQVQAGDQLTLFNVN